MKLTQSEILGFDTSKYATVSGEKAGFFDSVKNVFSNSMGVLASVFDGGLAIYGGVTERIRALNEINAETVSETPVVVAQDTNEKHLFGLSDTSLKTMLIGAGLVGVLFLLFKK